MKYLSIHKYIPRLLFITLLVWPGHAETVGSAAKPVFQITFQRGKLTLEATEASLEAVVDGIYREFSVSISGLDKKKSERINLLVEGTSLEAVLRRLFQKMGKKNFAFEFKGNTLKHVSVLPESSAPPNRPPPPLNPQSTKAASSGSVEVLEVIEGTQAEILGLQKGDRILEYDKIPLTRASELVKETKMRESFETVEILILRKGERVRFFFNGGYMGVRIKTVKGLPEAPAP